MKKYILYICIVGDDDGDRLIIESDKLADIDNAILETQEEVITNSDKYFLLNDFTFYSYSDFLDLVNVIRSYHY